MYEILLKGKAQEVLAMLETWAEEKRILGPGERIVFSLKIESVPTVCRNNRDTESEPPRELTIVRGHYRRSKTIPIAPAVCDLIIAQEIISLFFYEEHRRYMQNLLVFHGNGPTLVPIDGYSGGERMNGYYEGINKTLIENPIRGVYYRLVRNDVRGPKRQHYYQLFRAERKS